jgi:hypothetical protein
MQTINVNIALKSLDETAKARSQDQAQLGATIVR